LGPRVAGNSNTNSTRFGSAIRIRLSTESAVQLTRGKNESQAEYHPQISIALLLRGGNGFLRATNIRTGHAEHTGFTGRPGAAQ
jgi:hypothetical protein